MGQTDLPRCGRDESRSSPSGTWLDVAVILKIEKKDTAMGVFPDVSGRGATVRDAKRDAEAPFGSNLGPAASADEQMRPRTRATSSCRRSLPQGIIS